MDLIANTLSRNARLLKTKASRFAIYGGVIALCALVLATMLASYVLTSTISAAGMLAAQKANPVLWIMYVMPLGFMFWGQYVSSIIAYEAGAMIIDQTEELRTRTNVLEYKVLHDATHDALTDLPNRILFFDRLQQGVNTALREKKKIAILILDLDRFKEINDTLGHCTGDHLLKQVALRLKGITRRADTLARLGGDEFGIILHTVTSLHDIVKVARKIQAVFNSPFILEGLMLEVQASIGGALFPEHGHTANTIIQHADIAMYVAKQEQAKFMLYSSKLDTHTPHRLTLVGELRQAIENNQLLLHFQPKVNILANRVTEVEALVRWQHQRHGVMPPNDFIPLAEQTGLIKELTYWVLANSMQQAAAWQRQNINVGIAVNISAQCLLDKTFASQVFKLLATHNLSPKAIMLEITESCIMVDPDCALEVLTNLADAGIRISIDDFGTGYSSLAYLNKLPAFELKIDRSFVSNMLTDQNEAVIVHATIELAHNLGLQVVAEGIENEETLLKLKSLGCDFLQGYHINRPVNALDFSDWLQKSIWK